MLACHAASLTILPNIGGWVNGYLWSGEYSSKDGVKNWYSTLKKPSWSPPNWVFGPVWTSLYTGMGYASYLVIRDVGSVSDEAAKLPLALYGSQLLLNWAWSPIFFGYHKLKWSVVTIVALYANAVACGISFYRVNKVAGLLFIPYVAWLSLAAPLNIRLWQDNKEKDGVVITEITDAPKSQ